MSFHGDRKLTLRHDLRHREQRTHSLKIQCRFTRSKEHAGIDVYGDSEGPFRHLDLPLRDQ